MKNILILAVVPGSTLGVQIEQMAGNMTSSPLLQKSVKYNNDIQQQQFQQLSQQQAWDPDAQDAIDAQVEEQQRLQIEKDIADDLIQDNIAPKSLEKEI